MHQCALQIESRPTQPTGKFQRPGLALLVNNTVNINVANIASLLQCLSEWYQHLISELGLLDVPQNRALLPSAGAKVIVHQFLELPVFFPAFAPAARTKPPGYAHLNTFDVFLQDEWAFQLIEFLPPLQHVHHVVWAGRHIRERLVRLAAIASRLAHKPPERFLDVADCRVVVVEFHARQGLYSTLAQNLLPNRTVDFPFGSLLRSGDD